MKSVQCIIASILLVILPVVACNRQPQTLISLFPETIDGLRRVHLVTGTKALEKINKLHGKEIGVKEGAIGTYQIDKGPPVTVWISRSKTADLARHQTKVMIERMLSAPHSPFHHPAQRELQGGTLYQFQGMGQMHSIFCRHEVVYWISANMSQGDKVLEAFLPEEKERS